MSTRGPSELPGPVFASARGRLADARRILRSVHVLWDRTIVSNSMNDPWLQRRPDGRRELWVAFAPPSRLNEEIENASREFILAIKDALDHAVLATARYTCPAATQDGPDIHAMPLCHTDAEFAAFRAMGGLAGLRPDQVSTLEQIQPIVDSDAHDPFIVRHLTHLAQCLDLINNDQDVFGIWASGAHPQVAAPGGVDVMDVEVDSDGLVGSGRRIATIAIDPEDAAVSVRASPNVYFSPVLLGEPWPIDDRDLLPDRARALTLIVKHLIAGLENSVHTTLGTRVKALASVQTPDSAPAWRPVNFHGDAQRQDAASAIEASDDRLAVWAGEEGDQTLIYLRYNETGQIVGRRIEVAEPLELDGDRGPGVEDAVRAAASKWGLPDFVLRPKIVPKGSGIREIGDGTIVTGARGITLQVKARNVPADQPERATKWLLKNANAGLAQARGTIRTLSDPDGTLTNLRDQTVAVDGGEVEWVPVVVLDHPNPPRGVLPAGDSGPAVVILRRDWEFLWIQLRSASAIVDYIHRVKDEEPLELGAEGSRYIDLASKDAVAQPKDPPAWMVKRGGQTPSLPLLPADPAPTTDEIGFAVYQRVLTEFAETPFDGEQTDRMHVLAQLDRVAVAARADLGRVLLNNLAHCIDVDLGEHEMQNRLMFLDGHSIQLAFSTMSHLTDYDLQRYQTWLLHRRQTFLTDTQTDQLEARPWTVGILLTPTINAQRLWDTTVIATDGPPAFDQDDYDRISAFFPVGSTTPEEPDRTD